MPPLLQKPQAVKLFAGIPLNDAARAYVAQAADALKRSGVLARWAPAENWHVTLAFLGEIDVARTATVVSAFVSIRNQPPFSLRLSCIGAFPSLRRPRVLWVGGDEQEPKFSAAAQSLRSAFASLGFRFDDAALAHVTIGRSKGSAPFIPPQLGTAISIPVTRLALFESVRTSAGVGYVEREVVLLNGSL